MYNIWIDCLLVEHLQKLKKEAKENANKSPKEKDAYDKAIERIEENICLITLRQSKNLHPPKFHPEMITNVSNYIPSCCKQKSCRGQTRLS